MTDQITIEESKWVLPETFPAINQILDPAHEINIRCLIKETNRFEKQNSNEMALVKDWEKNKQNSTLTPQQREDYVGFFASNLANSFRSHSMFEPEAIRLFLAWARVSADVGNVDGMSDLFKYAVQLQLKLDFVKFWGEKTFKYYLEKLNYNYNEVDKMELILLLKGVVYMIAPLDAPLGFRLTMKLIATNDKLSKDDDNELHAYSEQLMKKIGGVRILEPILDIEDRNVQRTLELYSSLTRAVTPLVRTPDLTNIKEILDCEFPWFSDLTNRIHRQLLVRQLGDGVFFIPPTLILGPPGIGKTTYIHRLSILIDVPFKSLSLAGKIDNKDFTGTARGWSSGEPSTIINFINHKKIANPIFLLDEIDKAGGSDHNGRIHDTLLSLFEPSSATRIYDEYLGTHADLSHITWLSSANDVRNIPTTLLSRLDVITVGIPKKEHYPRIVNKSVEAFCKRNGIHSAHIPMIEETDWAWLSKYYSSPRVARRATEKWLSYRLLKSATVAN